MKKLTFYKWAFYLFLFSNLLLLVIIVVNKKSHPEPKEIIIERLQFSPEQIDRYEQEIRIHRGAIRQLEQQQIALKQQLYSHLDQDPNQAVLDRLENNYRKVQLINIAHFKAIRSLCSKKQVLLFYKLQRELPQLFTPRPPKK